MYIICIRFMYIISIYIKLAQFIYEMKLATDFYFHTHIFTCDSYCIETQNQNRLTANYLKVS